MNTQTIDTAIVDVPLDVALETAKKVIRERGIQDDVAQAWIAALHDAGYTYLPNVGAGVFRGWPLQQAVSHQAVSHPKQAE